MPSVMMIPPPKRAGPQLLASPEPRPPTMIGAGGPAAAPRPPPRPPKPPPSEGGAPVGPQPVVMPFEIHFKLRFFTVWVLICLRALKRCPVRSREYVVHCSVRGL